MATRPNRGFLVLAELVRFGMDLHESPIGWKERAKAESRGNVRFTSHFSKNGFRRNLLQNRYRTVPYLYMDQQFTGRLLAV
jgi:hypothetical protein